jgi:hypothetical protein
MKYFILLVILISSVRGFSQYEPINRHSLSYYYDGNQKMACTKMDSITAEGNDSIIWNYTSFSEFSWMTTFCTPFSWFGDKIVKKNNGIYIIYSKNQYSATYTDSIIIHTKDVIGSSWTFYGAVTATIENKTVINLFGQLDSVIVIRLASTGSVFDNKIISLSKNHGFVNTFNWKGLSIGNLSMYNLVAIDSISTDYHMLKLFDVYNYEVGDEFHIASSMMPGGPGPLYPSGNYTMIEILTKNYSVTTDTVTYFVHTTTWSSSYNNGISYVSPVVEDTSVAVYTDLNKYVSNYMFGHNVLPLAPSGDSISNFGGVYFQTYDTTCNRITEEYRTDIGLMENNGNNCFLFPEFPGGIPTYYYIEGVGVASFAANNYPDNPQPWSQSTDFVYIKKGNCITGTPMIRPLSISITNNNNIQIFPNPSNGIFNINVGDDKISEIEISNYLGEIVKKQSVNTKIVEVDLTEFPKGIYIVNTTGNKTMFGKLVKY